MKGLTQKIFELAPPGGLFDETVIENLYPDRSPGARNALVHRAVADGDVLRLKPGLFCLAAPFRKAPPHPFVIAATLLYPSHVSLESALSYHGLIPEAVREVSSVTTERSRRYDTPLGAFSFHRVPASHPRAGVTAVEVEPSAWVFLADPLRAVADLIYLRRGITWERQGLDFLTTSMRIEREDLAALSWRDFEEIRRSIRSRRVRAYLDGMKGELSA